MCGCCLHILTYSLFSCREIVELKVLLESQTDLNASLQRELQEGQHKVAAISQVNSTPCNIAKPISPFTATGVTDVFCLTGLSALHS